MGHEIDPCVWCGQGVAGPDACRDCGARFTEGHDGARLRSVARPWRRQVDAPFAIRGTGELPVVVHVPHAGLHIPPEVRGGILLDDDDLRAEQRALTDHRTDALAAGAIGAGARAFVNRLSRLVVDPERFPDPDDETMEQVGMGPVYVSTTDRRVLRRPTASQRQRLLDRWFVPYAEAFADEVDLMVERHGHCLIVDLHSFPSLRLPYEVGGDSRPDVCIGTDPVHTPEWLARAVEEVVHAHDHATARNTPFAGTYVPLRRWGDAAVSSVMLEVRRDLYMDETPDPCDQAHPWATPAALEPDVAWMVTAVVEHAARMPAARP